MLRARDYGDGGFVAEYLGDGMLVYFGYPQASEDDAERAVNAGFALVENVGQLETTSAAAAIESRHRQRLGPRRQPERRGHGAAPRRGG